MSRMDRYHQTTSHEPVGARTGRHSAVGTRKKAKYDTDTRKQRAATPQKAARKHTNTQYAAHRQQREYLAGKTGPDWVFIGGLFLVFTLYFLLHDTLGGTLFLHSEWDSYSLQAEAWLHGSAGLGQNYTWLEMAEYNGDWYVAFPMTPSLFLFPVVLFTGADTPNNFIVMVYAIAATGFAYQCLKRVGMHRMYAMFFAIVLVQGSNAMWMSLNGGVWFQAQLLNMLLCFAAVYCFQREWNAACMLLLALAVGCRPFSAVLFVVVFVLICLRAHEQGKGVFRQLKLLLLPAAVMGVYLWYNYVRFGNIFDFGRAYLPEYIEAHGVEFSWDYLVYNLKESLFLPLGIQPDGQLIQPLFNGFMFFIANPIFLIWFINIGKDIYKKSISLQKILLMAAFTVNFLLLAAHNTMGGWQFGNRYTIDLIPYVLLYMFIDGDLPRRLDKPTIFIGAFALIINLYGAMAVYLKSGFMMG